MTGSVDKVGTTRRTIVRGDRFASRDVHRAAANDARIRNNGRAVRADVEVGNCEFAQGFELFLQDVLVNDRLTVVARFHSDASNPRSLPQIYLAPWNGQTPWTRTEYQRGIRVGLCPPDATLAPCIQHGY